MDLTVKTETIGADDQRWLASAHGAESTFTAEVTIGATEAGKYGDVLPSGALIGAGGVVDPDGSNNTDEAIGFSITAIDISRGQGTYAVAVMWHGRVDEAARVAKGFDALDGGQKADLPHIKFV